MRFYSSKALPIPLQASKRRSYLTDPDPNGQVGQNRILVNTRPPSHSQTLQVYNHTKEKTFKSVKAVGKPAGKPARINIYNHAVLKKNLSSD